MGLADSDRIKISSAAGKIERNFRINRTIGAGCIFIPTAFCANDAMRLLRLEPLLAADSGGWVSCPVGVEKTEAKTKDR
jgi:formylmethanofuran dehydrogenase subunit D